MRGGRGGAILFVAMERQTDPGRMGGKRQKGCLERKETCNDDLKGEEEEWFQ